MPIQLAVEMTSELVTPRTLNRIRRENNERVGKDIVQYVTPVKFTRKAYSEYPGVVRHRRRDYAKAKRAKVGHDIPNVLTGKLRDSMKAGGSGHKITRTANGGKITFRFYWAGAGRYDANGKLIKSGARESQRQELEAVSPRQHDMLARRMEERFVDAVDDPKNRRKRKIKRKRG